MRAVFLTIGEKSKRRNEIGFKLSCMQHVPDKGSKEVGYAFISADDFDYIEDAFRSVFPLNNFITGELQKDFEVCYENYFDGDSCKAVIARIREIKVQDAGIIEFKEAVANWINMQLIAADYLIVEGNL